MKKTLMFFNEFVEKTLFAYLTKVLFALCLIGTLVMLAMMSIR